MTGPVGAQFQAPASQLPQPQDRAALSLKASRIAGMRPQSRVTEVSTESSRLSIFCAK